ncbi:MAG: ribosomal-protein-alanine N-acetyltransferase [Candidatus Nanopelagicaceae bacterium]|jgi:ribosomal-protein-alanine N-acetyltransferase|nr:ribosomal-protein-alanine N-acetyltransferase [Candidatus Nanopelagicaceae bacterium]
MITYREMIALDIPVLVGMEKEIYPESPWSAAQFREELAGIPRSRKYVVAIDENEIVGYGGIALAGDVADIHTLTVTPKFRRQGIATELLQQLEEWASAQGITTFMLEMREGNSEAQPLYEKHGYEVISKRDNYYSRGIHALIMRKEAGK